MFLVFYRLYRCVASQTERLHFTSSPRWNPGGFINETAICDALTDLTICGIETECKKMANGMFHTTASVRKFFTNYLKNINLVPYRPYLILATLHKIHDQRSWLRQNVHWELLWKFWWWFSRTWKLLYQWRVTRWGIQPVRLFILKKPRTFWLANCTF